MDLAVIPTFGTGSKITVDNSGDTITLVGVHASELHPSNFHFVDPAAVPAIATTAQMGHFPVSRESRSSSPPTPPIGADRAGPRPSGVTLLNRSLPAKAGNPKATDVT